MLKPAANHLQLHSGHHQAPSSLNLLALSLKLMRLSTSDTTAISWTQCWVKYQNPLKCYISRAQGGRHAGSRPLPYLSTCDGNLNHSNRCSPHLQT